MFSMHFIQPEKEYSLAMEIHFLLRHWVEGANTKKPPAKRKEEDEGSLSRQFHPRHVALPRFYAMSAKSRRKNQFHVTNKTIINGF